MLCPQCGGEMKIVAFITEAVAISRILNHLGEPAPDYEFDQRVAW